MRLLSDINRNVLLNDDDLGFFNQDTGVFCKIRAMIRP